MITFGTSPR